MKKIHQNLTFVVILSLYKNLLSFPSSNISIEECEKKENCDRGMMQEPYLVEADENDEDKYIDRNYDILDPCIDLNGHEYCHNMAKLGECEKNPHVMLMKCQKSCQVCLNKDSLLHYIRGNGDSCIDRYDDCPDMAFEGQCESNAHEMVRSCRYTCGYCVPDFEIGQDQHYGPKYNSTFSQKLSVLQTIRQSNQYLLKHVYGYSPQTKLHARIKPSCINHSPLCAAWATEGKCYQDERPNEDTIFKCPLACQACHYLDLDIRCPLEKMNLTNAWEPGSLNTMYERISTNPEFQKYNPTVISQPSSSAAPSNSSSKCAPWILTLDSFLTPAECERMIELGAMEGYEKSMTGNSETSHLQRTSENAWCDAHCDADPMVQSIINKIAYITQIPRENQEDFQLLKYSRSQFYKPHWDSIPYRGDGPRILTFFLYLNSVVEGGETNFPQVGKKIKPKQGSALIFPSVLNEDPFETDECSEHEALPVTRGEKFAANVWIHMRDSKIDDQCGIIA